MELLVYLKLLKRLFQNFSLSRDRPHLKEHLYAGVEAMEFPEKLKHSIVDALVSLIEVGKVHKVIKKFQNYQGKGAKEIETLANYLIRFRSLHPLSKVSEFRITNRRAQKLKVPTNIFHKKG